MNNNEYQFDVEFIWQGKSEWVPYGVPGEPPANFETRLEALQQAKRFSKHHNKRTRIAIGNVVHGFVLPDGTVVNATAENEDRQWHWAVTTGKKSQA